MFCRSAWPSDATWRWVVSSYTKFGKGLQSLETYTATVRVNDQGTQSLLVVTTSGPFLASDLRGSGTGALWGMAVLITSTSSSSLGDTTATVEHNDSNTGPAASNTSQVASSLVTSPAPTATAALPGAGLSTGAAVGIGAGAGAAALLMALGGWLLYRRGVAKGRITSGAIGQQQRKRAEEPTGHGDITTAAAAEWSSHYHQYQQPYHSYSHDVGRRPCELEPTPPAPRELE
ncbi:hypothetical protein INS49_000015 [Diaporthe citri]|uniref:uncharacterized protein n=1 Tax=Diaporthe citri TaxID=83186 RepID=UPI001C806DDE|nr:uncharacterized protein INS49_000015 [Diaporthe citri]KAG6365839.1 hypothetical protein INS49_000015 [Diaporthe citri]